MAGGATGIGRKIGASHDLATARGPDGWKAAEQDTTSAARAHPAEPVVRITAADATGRRPYGTTTVCAGVGGLAPHALIAATLTV